MGCERIMVMFLFSGNLFNSRKKFFLDMWTFFAWTKVHLLASFVEPMLLNSKSFTMKLPYQQNNISFVGTSACAFLAKSYFCGLLLFHIFSFTF